MKGLPDVGEKIKRIRTTVNTDGIRADIQFESGRQVEAIVGKSPVSMLENKIELLEEDIFCVHKWLDELGVPRKEINGEYKGDNFSIIGRVKLLLARYKR